MSGPVSGRILGKCPVRYPAGLITMSGRILSYNNNLYRTGHFPKIES